MQSLPEMNGAPGVSTFSFTIIFPGEKQANIWIIVVYHEIDIPKEMSIITRERV